MRISTRLLLPLIAIMLLVMVVTGTWLVRARSHILLNEATTEARAYATALAIGLEQTLARGDGDLGSIIEAVSAEPRIYGLIVYGAAAEVVAAAAPVNAHNALPPDSVRRALRTAAIAIQQRNIDGERFLSVMRRLTVGSSTRGVLEVLHPMSTVHADIARMRQRLTLSALVMLSGLILITLWMVRQIIGRPLDEFVDATRALARGELNFRIPPVRSGTEIEQLRVEFNNMGDELRSARERVAQETEERVALERQLRHTEKLAAVGNLAASLAHEIAAPLNVVAGRAEMLRQDALPPAQRDRHLGIITGQINRITLIVKNLLDYARGREPNMRNTNLARLVEDVVEFLEPELTRAGVSARVHVPPLSLQADADLLHQVFLNLLLNSMQALDTIEGERVIEISARTINGDVAIDIRDNGPGMAEDVAAKVFEPFYTTRPQSGGTGLGLAVARNIIADHGGTITSRAGAGGWFVITLPRPANV